MSQKLRRHIVDMKIKIDRQLILMSTMKEQIKGQVDEMQRMEVSAIRRQTLLVGPWRRCFLLKASSVWVWGVHP